MKFLKEKFNYHGGYLTYGKYPEKPEFVARFKYRGPVTMGAFKKELIKSHTVESYFAEREKGLAPLVILRNKNSVWYENLLSKFKEGVNK